MSTTDNTRFESLDGLRGVAAIAVVLFHFSSVLETRIFANGFVAVDLFFMLSGFVIAHSYQARLLAGMTLTDYLSRRFIRLYPMVLIGVLIGAFVLYFLARAGQADYSVAALWRSFLFNVFALPDINTLAIHDFESASIIRGEAFPGDPPLWSLFFEMVASLAFVLMIKLQPSQLRRLVIGSAAGFIVFALIDTLPTDRIIFDMAAGWGGTGLLVGFPRVLFGFGLGMLLYQERQNDWYQRWRARITTILRSPVWIYGLIALAFLIPKSLFGLYPVGLILIGCPLAVIACAEINPGDPKTRKLSAQLGRLSFPLYCVHFPIGRAVFWAAQPLISSQIALIGLSTAISLVCAYLLLRFYDEPVRAALGDLILRRRPAELARGIEESGNGLNY